MSAYWGDVMCLLLLLLLATSPFEATSVNLGSFLNSSGDHQSLHRPNAAPHPAQTKREAAEHDPSLTTRRKNRILLLLEPHCPIEIDTERQEECVAMGLPQALSTNGCHNLGVDNTWQYRTSMSAGTGLKGDCYRLRPTYKAAYTAMFRRAAPAMRRLGWTFDVANFGSRPSLEAMRSADVVVCSSKHYRVLSKRFPCASFAIIMTDDPATLERTIDYNDPQILAVLAHTSIVPLSENNLLPMFGRSKREYKGSGHPQSPRHIEWMAQGGTEMTPRCPPMGRDAMEKVVPLVPQVLRMRYPLDCGGLAGNVAFRGAFDPASRWSPPLAERAIDVLYVGATHRRSGSVLYRHRKAVVDRLRAIKAAHPHLRIATPDRIRGNDYVNMLRNSKLFVSPFGLGEFSGKDYESALAGCLLVKPLAGKLEAYPNIYKGSAALDVAVDFSNLEDVVLKALKDLPASQAKVDEQRRQLLEHDVEKVARDLDLLLIRRLLDGGGASSSPINRCASSLGDAANATIKPASLRCDKREFRNSQARLYQQIRQLVYNNCSSQVTDQSFHTQL